MVLKIGQRQPISIRPLPLVTKPCVGPTLGWENIITGDSWIISINRDVISGSNLIRSILLHSANITSLAQF
jgi:hypothetical protein